MTKVKVFTLPLAVMANTMMLFSLSTLMVLRLYGFGSPRSTGQVISLKEFILKRVKR